MHRREHRLTRPPRSGQSKSVKNNNEATHNHKRAGAVIVLRSTAELAEIQIPSSGEHFWVKLIDLTKLPKSAGALTRKGNG